jgi:hypothetical protein
MMFFGIRKNVYRTFEREGSCLEEFSPDCHSIPDRLRRKGEKK